MFRFFKKGSHCGYPFCREEATRTPDPYVPNVVRYQLRYFSNKTKARINLAPRSDVFMKVC